MYTISIKILLFTLLFLGVISCNFGPKPDKIVKITVTFDEKNGSNEEINTVVEILKNRINKISSDSKIERKQDSDQITIEVTTHYDPERIKDLVINEGRLDFYETYNIEEILPFLIETNNLLKKDDDIDPLLDIIKRAEYSSGAILFYASEKDTTIINHYLSFKGAETKLPAKRRIIRFVWGRQEERTSFFPLYALKLGKYGKPVLDQKTIEQAKQVFDQLARPAIAVQVNEEGAEIWERLTERAFQERFQIAMVINDAVYSAPGVSQGPIKGGKFEISSDFTVEEAQDLAIILDSGSISKMRIISFDVTQIN